MPYCNPRFDPMPQMCPVPFNSPVPFNNQVQYNQNRSRLISDFLYEDLYRLLYKLASGMYYISCCSVSLVLLHCEQPCSTTLLASGLTCLPIDFPYSIPLVPPLTSVGCTSGDSTAVAVKKDCLPTCLKPTALHAVHDLPLTASECMCHPLSRNLHRRT